jgi:hypothetical protein
MAENTRLIIRSSINSAVNQDGLVWRTMAWSSVIKTLIGAFNLTCGDYPLSSPVIWLWVQLSMLFYHSYFLTV